MQKLILVFNFIQMIRMRSRLISPTPRVYGALIHAHVNSGDISAGFALMAKMEDEGLKPDVVIYTTLINGLVSHLFVSWPNLLLSGRIFSSRDGVDCVQRHAELEVNRTRWGSVHCYDKIVCNDEWSGEGVKYSRWYENFRKTSNRHHVWVQ